ncbi:MAG: anti-sigma factor [Pyrinomonadaceae bacterium]
MSCEETQATLSLYVDDKLAGRARVAYEEHLSACPVCRAEADELRQMLRGLAALSRPVAPPDLAAVISRSLFIEAAAIARTPHVPLGARIMQWVKPRVMPYTVGAFASVILFAAMFTALRPHLMALRDWQTARRDADAASYSIIESLDEDAYDITKPISPAGYAARRAAYGAQSPSLDPRGALAALTWSQPRSRSGDEDMIVVADVYSNGNASLADVVRAPRDKRMLDDFQDALRKNPAFVPASFDRRPETMRVVFVFQKVDVPR